MLVQNSTIKIILKTSITILQEEENTPYHTAFFRTMKLFGLNKKQTAQIWFKFFHLNDYKYSSKENGKGKRNRSESLIPLISEVTKMVSKRMKIMSTTQVRIKSNEAKYKI